MSNNIMTRRAAFVAIVGDNSDDDENIVVDKITAYCESCATFGFNYKLGPRIYPNKDQPIPYDSDKWLQCYNCGTIVPRVHAKQENEITGIVDPPENIHDSNKVVVLSANRKDSSHAKSREIIDFIKRTRPGANRSKDYVDVDSDLRAQLQKGKQLVSYQSTNDEFQG